MKSFLATRLGKAASAGFLLLFVLWLILRLRGKDMQGWIFLEPLLLALILTAALWVAIDLGYGAWQKRRQASFDAKLAAREGIEDRKREWAEWTAELSRQGIDRYQLPMYLLIGEPQSGKSILLRNSDLHFPFGQNRLSGVGGTKGCDWWFTDQAVILDLAGRLFTHEGGRSDQAEWAAFLELLANYRPQCPANGVMLVLPCDGLASEAEAEVSRKASKMQAALLTLTDKLQVRLPVYVVLTKADKIFGFAECVHRLDAPKRHEMFGWSRPLEKLEAPFDLAETQGGFQGVLERARLLRAQMLATARIPEAQGEVDRLYAFPEELAALWPMLSLYLQRVFTESRLIDQLFFRGVYLTSGLQSGAPIARVCTELMGAVGEADRRNLEGLFIKQRAYFIKDLVRERIFTEQGLVRPTRQRVVRARRNARLAYGVAVASALVSVIKTTAVMAKESSDETVRSVDPELVQISQGYANGDVVSMIGAAARLERTADGLAHTPLAGTVKDAISGFVESTIARAVPMIALEAAHSFTAPAMSWPTSHLEFEEQVRLAQVLVSPSFGAGDLEFVLAFLKRSRGLEAPAVAAGSDCSPNLPQAEQKEVLARAERLWDGAFSGGSGWAKPGPLGAVLACLELEDAGYRLPSAGDDCVAIRSRTNALDLLAHSQASPQGQSQRVLVTKGRARVEFEDLEKRRKAFFRATGGGGQGARLERVRASVAGDGPFEVDPQAVQFLAENELLAVCRPAFMALDLARLPLELGQRPPAGSVHAAQVFEARWKCAGNEYVDAFSDATGLRARLLIPEGARVFDVALSEHLGSMTAALASDPGSEWQRHVARLVDQYEAGLLRDWSEDSAALVAELGEHLDSLGLRIETAGRENWLRAVVVRLAEHLGRSVPEAATKFHRLCDRAGVADFVRPLQNAANELSRNEGLAADRISALLAEASAAAMEPPASGAGAFVALSFRALCERAFEAKIRAGFRRELGERIGPGGTERGLVEAIWESSGRDADLSFFDRDGFLDQLRGRYRLSTPQTDAGPSSPARSGVWTLAEFGDLSSDLWPAVGFLFQFQAFLLAGDPGGKQAAASKVTIDVDCDERSPAFRPGSKASFYVQAGPNRKSDFIGSSMDRLSVQWSFTFSDFLFRWGDSDRPLDDDWRLSQAGPFAPLLFAWQGDRTPEGDWRIQRSVGPQLEAVLTLHFDRPLPPLPPKPTFTEP